MTTIPLLLALLATPAAAPAPEAWGRKGVVAADHALASHVGVEVLKAGGDAVDAAVATTLALGVLNPQSSGLGGGGFAVVWRAKEGKAYILDFRETAPAGLGPDAFTRPGLAADASRKGGLAVGVPGEVAGLAKAHGRWGRLPWKRLVDPATKLAAEGFPCDKELERVVRRYGSKLLAGPGLAKFLRRPDGSWPAFGDLIVRPGLAKTLDAVGRQGRAAFYEGPVAKAIAETARKAGGVLTEADLSGYRVKERLPLRGLYRGHTIYTMPPPSSGGAALLQVLTMLEARRGLPKERGNPERIGVMVEALKHAFADRARWMGDPDFSPVPVDRLLDGPALRVKARSLDPSKTRPSKAYGLIAPPADDSGTSHLSVIDAEGNAVALSTTINTGFGSWLVAGDTGVVLNNQMDDFTTRPGAPNVYGLMQSDQNAVVPGKRPLSSMTPTVVVRGSGPGRAKAVLVVGGSGGPRIITGTLQVLLNVIDHHDGPGQAVAAPRIHHQWLPNELRAEPGALGDDPEALKRAGHAIVVKALRYGAIQAATVRKDGMRVGAADPRKKGRAAAH